MEGYIKLEKDGEWIPAIVCPSMFGGYDAKIGDTFVCGLSDDAVKFDAETVTKKGGL